MVDISISHTPRISNLTIKVLASGLNRIKRSAEYGYIAILTPLDGDYMVWDRLREENPYAIWKNRRKFTFFLGMKYGLIATGILYSEDPSPLYLAKDFITNIFAQIKL